MCNAFEKVGIHVDLYLPESKGVDKNSVSFFKKKFGIEPLFELNFYQTRYKNSKLNKYFSQKQIKNILDKSNAEFVFLRRHNYLKAALKSNKQVIFESHNNLLHNRKKLIEKFFKYNLLRNAKHNNFKLFISISENLKKYWIEQNIPEEKSIALHDGFDKQMFNCQLSMTKVRDMLSLPREKKIITYCGSLYPDRGIENIIQLASKLPNVYFCVIGGTARQKEHYDNILKSNNMSNVHFVGSIPHSKVALYLNASDVLLALWSDSVPTINYCSPLKIFEYMASGKTIVAHDFVTIKEVLTHNYSALLADHQSFDDLYDKVNDALTLDTGQLGSNARNEAFLKYSWEIRAKSIMDRLET